MSVSPYPFQLPLIRWADVSVIEPRAPLLPRQLYDHELVYVLDGHGTINIHNHPQPAQPDYLFLIQPRMWHSFVSDADAKLRLLGVHFDWSPEGEEVIYPLSAEGKEDLFREPREIAGWDLMSQPFLELQNRREVRRDLEAVVTEYQLRDSESIARSGALLAAAILSIERTARQMQELRESTFVGQTRTAASNVPDDYWKQTFLVPSNLLQVLSAGAPITLGVFAKLHSMRNHRNYKLKRALLKLVIYYALHQHPSQKSPNDAASQTRRIFRGCLKSKQVSHRASFWEW